MTLALVLQGGGALGAYEAGAIAAFCESTSGFRPDIVSGVSIGAINAAVLLGGRVENPAEALHELWERLAVTSLPMLPEFAERFLAAFGNPSMYWPRTDWPTLMGWTSLYDTTPLRSLLEELVDLEKLRRLGATRRLIVTAVNLRTGDLEAFDNTDPQRPLTIDHLVASASLPPAFPPTRIGNGDYYWDGGLVSNTPLRPVLEACRRLPAGQAAEFVLINVFPKTGRVPRNLFEVMDRMFEILFASRIKEDVDTFHRVNEFVAALETLRGDGERVGTGASARADELLERYRRFAPPLIITNSRPEPVFAPFDFSRASIAERWKAGREDALAAIKQRDGVAAESRQ